MSESISGGLIVAESENAENEKAPRIPENLAFLPVEVAEEIMKLSPEITGEFTEQSEQKEAEPVNPAYQVFDDMRREDRHNNAQWNAEEIKKMPPEVREICTVVTLASLLKSAGFSVEDIHQPEVAVSVMDKLWGNRQLREGEFTPLGEDVRPQVNAELEELKNQKDALQKEVDQLNAKINLRAKPKKNPAPTDPSVRLGLAREKLAEFKMHDGTQVNRMRELRATLGRLENEQKWQETLGEQLKYFSAEDFAILFGEAATLLLKPRRFREKTQPRSEEIDNLVIGWAENHASEGALEYDLPPEKKERLKTLVDYLQAHIESYRINVAKYSPTEIESAKNTMLATLATIRRVK